LSVCLLCAIYNTDAILLRRSFRPTSFDRSTCVPPVVGCSKWGSNLWPMEWTSVLHPNDWSYRAAHRLSAIILACEMKLLFPSFLLTSASGDHDGRSKPGQSTTVNTTAAVVAAVLIGVIITLVTVIVVIARRKR